MKPNTNTKTDISYVVKFSLQTSIAEVEAKMLRVGNLRTDGQREL